MTSQPRLASVSAAAASLAGSNQVSIITSLVVIFGLTACAASVKAFTPITTSGILKDPRKPIVPVFDIMPAIVPITARP